MPEFIEDRVLELADSTSSDPVRLLVGSREGLDELGTKISEIEGEVLEQVGRTTVRASVPERNVAELCDLPGVVSVEFDDNNVRLQSGEDFQHPENSMM